MQMEKPIMMLSICLFAGAMLCSGQRDEHGYDTSNVALNRQLTDYAWSIKAGFINQSGNLIELGILRQKFYHDIYFHTGMLQGTSGPSIACEFDLDFDKRIIGPKIAYEYHVYFVSAKPNLIYYTNFSKSSLCFSPELGITFLGFIVLSGRLNLPFYNRELVSEESDVSPGVGFTINYPIARKKLTVRELRKRDE